MKYNIYIYDICKNKISFITKLALILKFIFLSFFTFSFNIKESVKAKYKKHFFTMAPHHLTIKLWFHRCCIYLPVWHHVCDFSTLIDYRAPVFMDNPKQH